MRQTVWILRVNENEAMADREVETLGDLIMAYHGGRG